MRNFTTRLALVALVVASASGCDHTGGAASATSTTATTATTVTVAMRAVAGVGPVLTGPDGRTLYLFVPDAGTQVRCLGNCPQHWPPLMLPGHAKLAAGAGVAAALLGTTRGAEPDTRQVTYAGWPLYGYVGDVEPNQANGQRVFLDGGDWFAMGPDGHPALAS